MSDMEDHINIEVAEVRACRGCLARRCKLHDIREKRLEQVFSDLTGLPVSGGLLCSTCLHLVHKFNAFRVRCRYSGHVLNMLLLNEDALNSVDRSNLIVPISQSKILHIDCESTRELFTTDVLHVNLPDETNFMDETDFKPEKTFVKVENISTFDNIDDNTEDTDSYNFETSTHIDDTNVPDPFTDINKNDDEDVETDIDSADENMEPDKQPVVEKSKSEADKVRSESAKYFTVICRAVKKVNGDLYQMFERLYKFSRLKERPDFPEVFHNRETKSELYNFIKFLDLFKEAADSYKVYVEFISIMEEKRAMDEKRRALAEDKDHCGKCCRKCVKASTRERHAKLSHNEAFPFRCEVCMYTFKKESQLKMHLFKFHTTRKKCKECDQTIAAVAQNSQWNEVLVHKAKYHCQTRATCEFCGRTFIGSQKCYSHIRQVHRGEMNAVQCWLCGDSYNGPQGIRAHVRRMHNEAVKCPTCGVYFKNKEAMAAHVTGTGKCQKDVSGCPMCGATFPTESLMKEHYDDIHALYKCQRCTRSFIEYDSFKMHYYKICANVGERLPPRGESETGDPQRTCKKKTKSSAPNKYNNSAPKKYYNNRYICDVCGKGFAIRISFQYHLRIHTGEKPHKCEYCDKSFRIPNLLQLHERTHTGARPYLCARCPKAFKSAAQLMRHQVVHTRIRRYRCPVCDKTFMTSTCVNTHVRTVHMKIPQKRRTPRRYNPKNKHGHLSGSSDTLDN